MLIKLSELKLGDKFYFEQGKTLYVVSGFTRRLPLKIKVKRPEGSYEWKYDPHTFVYKDEINE